MLSQLGDGNTRLVRLVHRREVGNQAVQQVFAIYPRIDLLRAALLLLYPSSSISV
jgi:hypothetical protein